MRTVSNVSHYWSRGQKNEQQIMGRDTKSNAAAAYLGPVKIELRKDAGALIFNNAL